jgi:drug/metabolite transporter (DMT)-like permease
VTGTLFVLFATFFWALDTLIRYPLLEAGLSPIQIVFTEHLLLVLGMSSWLLLRRQRIWQFTKRDWPALLVIGGLGSAIGTLAFTEAFSYMNPTLVILLQKLQPLVAISLAAWVLKEKIPVTFVLCAVFALTGSFLIMYDDLSVLFASEGWHYSAELTRRLMGYGFTLVAVFSWGASTVFGKKLAIAGHSSAQIMNGRFAVGLIVLLPFFAMGVPFETSIDLSLGRKILLMVVISGVLGMVFYYQGLKRIESKHSALAEMGFPIMAGLINWVVLGFALTPLQIVGGVLLIFASFAVHITPRSNIEPPLETVTT